MRSSSVPCLDNHIVFSHKHVLRIGNTPPPFCTYSQIERTDKQSDGWINRRCRIQ